MINKMITPLWYATLGASGLHLILGFMAGLSQHAIRDYGIFFTILGILSLFCVVAAAFVHPLLVIPSLAIIILPGMIISVVVRMILTGMLVMLIATPGIYLYEVFKIIMSIYGIV
ncbi:MAG: hypothetical protein E7253_09985 [Lachnospiraceae bacterium]|nr:hypothetical protein [Lachnospiraceae bacterium]